MSNTQKEIQFLKTDSGFELYCKISSLNSFLIMIRFPGIILILFILFMNHNNSNMGQIVLFICTFVGLGIALVYFATARQYIILENGKLNIGVVFGSFRFRSQSINYQSIYGVKYYQKDQDDYASIVLEMKNDDGEKDSSQNVSFGKYLTLERCKHVAWQLNNYLNGVA